MTTHLWTTQRNSNARATTAIAPRKAISVHPLAAQMLGTTAAAWQVMAVSESEVAAA